VKIQGTFLSSRAARRIFWTLLLAAAAPIATFGVAMHELLSEQFESQAARQNVQLVKFAGMGLLDRLLVARTALTVVARTGRVEAETEGRGRYSRVLVSIAQLDTSGHTLVGSAALSQAWQGRVAQWLLDRGNSPATLLVGSEHDSPRSRTVLLAVMDETRRDRVWIAEIEQACARPFQIRFDSNRAPRARG